MGLLGAQVTHHARSQELPAYPSGAMGPWAPPACWSAPGSPVKDTRSWSRTPRASCSRCPNSWAAVSTSVMGLSRRGRPLPT